MLVSGILYLNQFRAGLIDARVASLLTRARSSPARSRASATDDAEPDQRSIRTSSSTSRPAQSLAPLDDVFDAFEFPINPERVAPILRRLISPTRTRARIYDRDGTLIVDSRHLYSRGQILGFDLPPPAAEDQSLIDRVWQTDQLWLQRSDLPLYEELGAANGKGYPEVVAARSTARRRASSGSPSAAS